jgi:hypothetical protein
VRRLSSPREHGARRALPEGVSPAQVRGALTAVIRKTLEARHVACERMAAD